MADYDIQSYLLDRANIHDIITQMCLAFDTYQLDKLATDVYTPTVYIDYSQLVDMPASDIPVEQWRASLELVFAQWDSIQHAVADMLIDLPQPSREGTGIKTTRPDRCTLQAYVHASAYKKDEEGKPRVMMQRNGGRYNMELVRLPELEEKGENPWRIRSQKVVMAYQDVGAQPQTA